MGHNAMVTVSFVGYHGSQYPFIQLNEVEWCHNIELAEDVVCTVFRASFYTCTDVCSSTALFL